MGAAQLFNPKDLARSLPPLHPSLIVGEPGQNPMVLWRRESLLDWNLFSRDV